jgi:hypothetical protein
MGPIHRNFISWWPSHMLITWQPDKILRDLRNSKGCRKISTISMVILVSGIDKKCSWTLRLQVIRYRKLEVCHPCCAGSITKNFVYYKYSQYIVVFDCTCNTQNFLLQDTGMNTDSTVRVIHKILCYKIQECHRFILPSAHTSCRSYNHP